MNPQRLTGFMPADRRAFTSLVERLAGSERAESLRRRLPRQLWRAERRRADEQLEHWRRAVDERLLARLGRRELGLLEPRRAAILGLDGSARAGRLRGWLQRLWTGNQVGSALEMVLSRAEVPPSELVLHAGLHRLARRCRGLDFTQACWLAGEWPQSWRRTFLASLGAYPRPPAATTESTGDASPAEKEQP